jgi:hypothetical protein
LSWMYQIDLNSGMESILSFRPSWDAFWSWLAYIASISSYLFEGFSANINQIVALFAPAVIVLCIELAVDSLKHAFITKFNQIKVCFFVFTASLMFISDFNNPCAEIYKLHQRRTLLLVESVSYRCLSHVLS